MPTQLDKWLAYYRPILRGRFDFFVSGGSPRREAWHQGLALAGGRFWMRIRGGHDLRRIRVSSAEDGDGPRFDEAAPEAADLVGRADGSSATVATFPWVGHPASAEYVYGLFAVGAGGMPETNKPPVMRIKFDETGALVGPAPNPAANLAVEPISDGRFHLRWTYDERDQEQAPSSFRLYNDAGNPGQIDFAAVVATASYRRRQGFFNWVSEVHADGARLHWAVRAASSEGVEGPASNIAFGVASAAKPPPPQGLRLTQ